MLQHEPGVAGPLADPAVGDHVVLGAQTLLGEVDRLELGAGLERGVLGGGAGPGHRAGSGDVPAAQGPLLRVVGHVGALAGVLLRRADIDQRVARPPRGGVGTGDPLQHVLLERPDGGVVPLDDGVVARRRLGHVGGHRPALRLPQRPAAVQQPHVGVAEQGEHPQRVGGPPVALVAVDHHGRVPADSLAPHQVGERVAVEVVALHLVVQLGVPVDLDRAGDVAGVVEQHVLVALHHHQARGAQVLGQPVGGDQALGVGVLGKLRGVVQRQVHAPILPGGTRPAKAVRRRPEVSASHHGHGVRRQEDRGAGGLRRLGRRARPAPLSRRGSPAAPAAAADRFASTSKAPRCSTIQSVATVTLTAVRSSSRRSGSARRKRDQVAVEPEHHRVLAVGALVPAQHRGVPGLRRLRVRHRLPAPAVLGELGLAPCPDRLAELVVEVGEVLPRRRGGPLLAHEQHRGER